MIDEELQQVASLLRKRIKINDVLGAIIHRSIAFGHSVSGSPLASSTSPNCRYGNRAHC